MQPRIFRSFSVFIMISLVQLLILGTGAPPCPAEEAGHRVIRVGGDNSYPPYEYQDTQNTPRGFNIDMIQAVSRVMGLNTDLALGPWNKVRQDLEQGRIDVISGMYFSEERARKVLFSEPHILVSYALFVRVDSEIKGLADVARRGIIVQAGDMGDDYVTQSGWGKPVVRVDNPEAALRMLAAGGQECALLPRLLGFYLIHHYALDNLVAVGPPFLSQKYCFAVKQGDEKLVGILNEGLSIIKNTGEYARIYDKWFGAYEKSKAFSRWLTYLLWILIPLLTVLVGLAVWTWLLKRTVAERTKDLMFELAERKRTEQDLAQSRSQYQTLIKTIPDLIWLKDPDGVYISCNQTFERFFGASESQIVGKTDYDFVDKDLADFFRGYDRQAMAMNRPSVNEEWLTFAADGYHGLFETVKTPMRSPDGELIGVLGVARDVTERKKAEENHKLNARRYQAAQRVGKVGNWEYDIARDMFWGSDQTCQIFGLSPEKKAFTLAEVESVFGNGNRMHDTLMDLIHKGAVFDTEFQIGPVSGRPQKIVRLIAELVKDETGLSLKVIGVVHDITARKKAEKEKEGLEQRLMQSQKMEAIGRLAGGVAHDFNNMLSVILGNTELVLQDMAETTPRFANLMQIHRAAERSASLTRQLLAFARRQPVLPEVLDLNHVLDQMLTMLKRLIGESIDLLWKPGRGLWRVKMDPSQVDQILANLCINARDAINGVGKVTIETGNIFVTPEESEQTPGFLPGQFVIIKVTDTGVGMDTEIQNKLFEPFFTTKKQGQGTGLGLSTVYGIVKQNDGFIHVVSEPGKGAAFHIYLPACFDEVLPLTGTNDGQLNLQGNEQILLVEDEKAILDLEKAMLQSLGYHTMAALTPREALRIAEATNAPKIDLLMTDVILPEMNGKELANRLRAVFPEMKCLFVSGYPADIIAHRDIHDPEIHFLGKPFSKNQLAEMLRRILDGPVGKA